ncbi:MAG TPA: HPr(Ser) kinase/phosphatase, partial [Pyrinomonadaceae bacterium]|nr:HPr(Ser) kinase/phosphatase [Pyrinomonadaceae bacterium]
MQSRLPTISVRELVESVPAEMPLEVLAGQSGLENRKIDSPRIQKLGLALAGFAHYIHAGRVQVVGQSEISYLNQLEPERKNDALAFLDVDKISCILVTKGLDPPTELLALAAEHGIPLLRTPLVSSIAILHLTTFLHETLAPQMSVHGVLMEMFGIGVLIVGDSGIGKSECALDLIGRGHRLIADDSVRIKKIGTLIEGSAPELIRDFLEIHGLGIVNVREIFGITAIGKPKKVELAISLKRWDEFEAIDRLGIETQEEEVFGIKIPKFVLPVSPGRTIATLVETAVRIYMLKLSGYNAAQSLIAKHRTMVGS